MMHSHSFLFWIPDNQLQFGVTVVTSHWTVYIAERDQSRKEGKFVSEYAHRVYDPYVIFAWFSSRIGLKCIFGLSTRYGAGIYLQISKSRLTVVLHLTYSYWKPSKTGAPTDWKAFTKCMKRNLCSENLCSTIAVLYLGSWNPAWCMLKNKGWDQMQGLPLTRRVQSIIAYVAWQSLLLAYIPHKAITHTLLPLYQHVGNGLQRFPSSYQHPEHTA